MSSSRSRHRDNRAFQITKDNIDDEHVTNDNSYYNNDSDSDCNKADVDGGVDYDGCRHKHIQI